MSDKNVSAEGLLDILFNLFSPDESGFTLVEKNPLQLLLVLDHFVSQLTVEYLGKMQSKKGDGEIDVVHHGNTYLEQTIEKALAKLPETLLQNIGLMMVSSRIVSELRGFLGLCLAESFLKIGNPKINTTKLASAAKGCYAVDNVLTRLRSTALTLSKLQVNQSFEPPDFNSLNEAPRLAMIVLTMFGALG